MHSTLKQKQYNCVICHRVINQAHLLQRLLYPLASLFWRVQKRILTCFRQNLHLNHHCHWL